MIMLFPCYYPVKLRQPRESLRFKKSSDLKGTRLDSDRTFKTAATGTILRWATAALLVCMVVLLIGIEQHVSRGQSLVPCSGVLPEEIEFRNFVDLVSEERNCQETWQDVLHLIQSGQLNHAAAMYRKARYDCYGQDARWHELRNLIPTVRGKLPQRSAEVDRHIETLPFDVFRQSHLMYYLQMECVDALNAYYKEGT